MSISKKSHTFDKKTASEYVVLADSHGRELHLQAPIFASVKPQEFIEKAIAEFEAQEKRISEHIAAYFDPITLKKK